MKTTSSAGSRRGLLTATVASIALLASLSLPSFAEPGEVGNAEFTLEVLTSGSVTTSESSRWPSTGIDAQREARHEADSLTMLSNPKTGMEAIADLSLATSASVSDAPAMYAANPGFVDLSWAPISGVDAYRVYKEDRLIAETDETSVRDVDVKPGDVVSYRIESKLPEDGSDARTWGLLAVVPSYDEGASSSLSQSFEDQLVALAAYSGAQVQYQTFIPQAKINAPPAGCGAHNYPHKFGGDNRGYLASGYPYRTKVEANVTFSGSGLVKSSSYLGSTKVYSKSGVLLGTKKATGTTLTASRLSASTASSVDVRFTVRAGNPYCTSFPNSISGQFTITVNKSGSWSIVTGTHKQMPNHEVYIRSSTGGWKTVYRRTYVNATCLVNGACPNANMTGYYGKY